jgi:hypothetical protein
MASGPEHYREAERIVDLISIDDHYRNYHLQQAQVHATLALAAATALSGNADLPSMDEDAWIQAASAYTRGEQP